jgi:hypothetical protein
MNPKPKPGVVRTITELIVKKIVEGSAFSPLSRR